MYRAKIDLRYIFRSRRQKRRACCADLQPLSLPPVLYQYDKLGFSVLVVFRSKAQWAGNGQFPCQALQRGCGAPQGRPAGELVSVHGLRCTSWQGGLPLPARCALP